MSDNIDWEEFYNSINKNLDDSIRFFNHGYYPFIIEDSEEIFSTSENLYHFVFLKATNFPRKILEIGVGRGGGINSLKKKYENLSFFGIDISRENINFCQKNYQGITFDKQDATDINFSESFDLIINIESMHCYSNKLQFLKESKRLLVDGGTLLLVDVFTQNQIENFKKELEIERFKLVEITDITEGTIESCKIITDRLDQDVDLDKNLKSMLKKIHQKNVSSYQSGKNQYLILEIKSD